MLLERSSSSCSLKCKIRVSSVSDFPQTLHARCFAAVTSSRLICACWTRHIVELGKKKTKHEFPENVQRIATQFRDEDAWINTALAVGGGGAGVWCAKCAAGVGDVAGFFALTHFDTCGGVEPFVVRLHVMWLLSLLVVMLSPSLCSASPTVESAASNSLSWLCLAHFWSAAICGRGKEKTFVMKEVIWLLESLKKQQR